MHKINIILRRDAIIRILLGLYKSPALPDQIEPSGPGLGITGPKL